MKIKELFEMSNNDTETIKLIKQLQDATGVSSYSLKNLVVLPDGSINCEKAFMIDDALVDENGELKIKINKAHSIGIRTDKLTSFSNFPDVFEARSKDFVIFVESNYAKGNIKTFGNMKTNVLKGSINLKSFPKLLLSNIHKHIPVLNGDLIIHNEYKGPLLSTLKIRDLQVVETSGWDDDPIPELAKALEIINDHLQRDGNVLNCQEELIDSGLEDYAQL